MTNIAEFNDKKGFNVKLTADKIYISAIEDFIGAKISSISTSPEREDTILLENPFDL